MSAMSDNYIRLVPDDLRWQPDPEAAIAVTDYLARLFDGPAESVDEVSYDYYDEITLIDAGTNTERITCPACGGDIDVEWFFDLVADQGDSFEDLTVTVPCCEAVTTLDALHYDWPVGFGRFAVTAMNVTRPKYALDASELDTVAALLGRPVKQILVHY